MKKHSFNLTYILTLFFGVSLLFSCVPARQFEDLQKKEKTCQDELARLKSENQALTTENTEMKASGAEMQKDITELVKDTTELGMSYHRLTGLYNELMKSYDKLLSNNEKLLAGNTEETRKLLQELNAAREDLQKKEERMKRDSVALDEREKSLAEMQTRVNELQGILSRQDSAVNRLKRAVSDALLGYENNGLSVYQKEGRVYVSMEERLLFASGSTVIESDGESALKDLAKVLASNKDINVMVEGHTDNVPIKGTLASGARDNWELSVLRATSVVKIILKDASIDPTRLTASGKGPYMPIDPGNTAEARRKNRRTEVILSPKLDELMKVLEGIK